MGLEVMEISTCMTTAVVSVKWEFALSGTALDVFDLFERGVHI